jgi:hypothetical protein
VLEQRTFFGRQDGSSGCLWPVLANKCEMAAYLVQKPPIPQPHNKKAKLPRLRECVLDVGRSNTPSTFLNGHTALVPRTGSIVRSCNHELEHTNTQSGSMTESRCRGRNDRAGGKSIIHCQGCDMRTSCTGTLQPPSQRTCIAVSAKQREYRWRNVRLTTSPIDLHYCKAVGL